MLQVTYYVYLEQQAFAESFAFRPFNQLNSSTTRVARATYAAGTCGSCRWYSRSAPPNNCSEQVNYSPRSDKPLAVVEAPDQKG